MNLWILIFPDCVRSGLCPVLTFIKLFQSSFSILTSLLLYEAHHIFLTQSSLVFSLHISLFPVYPAAFLNSSLKSHFPAKIKTTNTHQMKTKQCNTPLPSWTPEKFLIYYRKCQNPLVCYSRIFKVSPPTYISKLPSLSTVFALPADH